MAKKKTETKKATLKTMKVKCLANTKLQVTYKDGNRDHFVNLIPNEIKELPNTEEVRSSLMKFIKLGQIKIQN